MKSLVIFTSITYGLWGVELFKEKAQRNDRGRSLTTSQRSNEPNAGMGHALKFLQPNEWHRKEGLCDSTKKESRNIAAK